MSKLSRGNTASELFKLAEKERNRGNMRSAFRHFLAAAKAGDRASQLNVGYLFDTGMGTRRNRGAALRWYMRAYRRGDASAASNIGTIWRNEKKPERALFWFKRAAKMGDDGSNLEIAIHYLENKRDPKKAITHLRKVCVSDRVSEADGDKAKQLLRKLKNNIPAPN